MGKKAFSLRKQQKILQEAREYVIGKGGVPTPDRMYQYQLMTSVGILQLSFCEGYNLASIFCRFDEPELAIPVIGERAMNPYSGKWNWHIGRDSNVDWYPDNFKKQIDGITQSIQKNQE